MQINFFYWRKNASIRKRDGIEWATRRNFPLSDDDCSPSSGLFWLGPPSDRPGLLAAPPPLRGEPPSSGAGRGAPVVNQSPRLTRPACSHNAVRLGYRGRRFAAHWRTSLPIRIPWTPSSLSPFVMQKTPPRSQARVSGPSNGGNPAAPRLRGLPSRSREMRSLAGAMQPATLRG
jgi:hypothetical protein